MHRINLLLMSFIVSYKVELTVRNPELKISKKMHELYKNKSLIFKSYIYCRIQQTYLYYTNCPV